MSVLVANAEGWPFCTENPFNFKQLPPFYLLGQWLNFKLFGITYLVGKIKFKLFFSGSIGWVSLLQAYPPLQTHRFIHGILSTESGPSIHFMSVYGFAGADVHQEAQQKNDQLFQAVFDYASCFGNTPVYIGMDSNTDTLSSRSISRPCLSQRWTVCPTFPSRKGRLFCLVGH